MVSRRAEGGFIVPGIVMALGVIVLGVIIGANVLTTKQLANRFAEDRDAYLDEVRTAIETWYASAISMEADAGIAYTSDDLFSKISVRPRYGVHLIMSSQLNDGLVRYHKIAIVAPDVAKGPVAQNGYGQYSTSGVFSATPGFAVKEFSGNVLQHKAVSDTTKAMQALASMLELRVTAKMQIDPTRESTTNYFLPKLDCFNVGDDEFPCTNGWAPIGQYLSSASVVGTIAGITTKDAWGGDIQLNNDYAENPASAPFTASLQSITPWGSPISIKAVQPIF